MIVGWDTTIDLIANAGEAVVYDQFNSLELCQIICVPSNLSMTYEVDVYNNDFGIAVYGRTWAGKSNELLNLPLFGHNLVRISNASLPGSVVVAMRFRWP